LFTGVIGKFVKGTIAYLILNLVVIKMFLLNQIFTKCSDLWGLGYFKKWCKGAEEFTGDRNRMTVSLRYPGAVKFVAVIFELFNLPLVAFMPLMRVL